MMLSDKEIQTLYPKSLWPYYNMLPDYARNDPIVRRIFMVLEYHQHMMSLENKQRALNLVAKARLPIGPNLKRLLLAVLDRNKMQLNMERAKEMQASLKVFEIDEEELGEPFDDGIEETVDNGYNTKLTQQDSEKHIQSILEDSRLTV